MIAAFHSTAYNLTPISELAHCSLVVKQSRLTVSLKKHRTCFQTFEIFGEYFNKQNVWVLDDFDIF